ncbi:hypothetical protein [Streptomyces sp. NPDC092952]|uniref:hypothetical protein n=1 Tax=Streptomyces sp. NPDC092952 TaxID=3366018 RepID=UPI00380CE508
MITASTELVTLAAGPVFGGAGTAGLALADGIVLLAGLRGSDRVKLNRDKAAALGIGMGTLSAAADTVLSQIGQGSAQIPTSLVTGGTFGSIGMGGVALAVTGVIFLFDWKKLIVPAFLGTGAGVIYAEAGGIWSIGHNAILALGKAVGAL